MTRWKAAGIHVVFSIVLALATVALLFFVWFPPPLFAAAGGDRLVALLITIDIVIGPLLTLIVFRPGKRGLRFDLTVIAILQLGALVYGLHVMAEARPVWLVHAVDRFIAVSASSIDDADRAKAKPEFRALSWTGPRVVGTRLPESGDEQLEQLERAFAGKDVEREPRYYVDYDTVRSEVASRRRPLSELAAKDAKAVDAFVQEHGGRQEDYGFLPLVARSDDVAIVLDANGEMVGFIDVDPW
jgi:hypothetical protein